MKINKKIVIIAISVIILVVLLFGLVKYFDQKKMEEEAGINKESLSMVEEYLNNKYNMKLKLKNYFYYDNGVDLNRYDWNPGEHYTFNFEPIDGIKLYANLDMRSLKDENALNYLKLNITDIDKANKLKEYIEENSGLKCNIAEYRLVEGKNYDNYYYFRVEFEKNPNDWITGNIYDDENIKEINISSTLEDRINLKNNDDITLKKILELVNQNLAK